MTYRDEIDLLRGPTNKPISRANTHNPTFWPLSCSKNKSLMIASPTVDAGLTPNPWKKLFALRFSYSVRPRQGKTLLPRGHI